MSKCRFAKYLALALLVLLFAGCGKKARRSDAVYDLVPSELMLDIGFALLENPEDAARITANLHVDDLAMHEWVDEARKLSRLNEEYHRRHRLFVEANEMLAQGRMNDLTERIDLAEQQGESSVELLTLRELPLALQSLELYCRRMPFQHSEDVEYALAALMPYRPVLERSPAFCEFLEGQRAFAAELRTAERLQEIARLMGQLDGAICCGREAQVRRVISELRAGYPEAPLLKWLEGGDGREAIGPSQALLSAVTAGSSPLPADASEADRMALELSMALCRPRLERANASGFGDVVAAIQDKSTVTGTALNATCQKSVARFEEAIRRWDDARSKAPALFDRAPLFLEDYLKLCGLRHRIPRGASPMDVMASMEGLLVWIEAI